MSAHAVRPERTNNAEVGEGREEKEKQRIFLGNRTQKEKLMTEVKAPYRQNWIGYFSLMVAVLSIIVSQFPELLEPTPLTRFPDL